MKIRYTLTKSDVVIGSLRALPHNRAAMLYLCVMSTVLLGLYAKDAFHEGKGAMLIIISCLIQFLLICIFCLFGAAVVTLLSLVFGKGKGIVCEHELEILGHGLKESTEYNESIQKWPSITKVFRSGGFQFIRVSESGGALHLIPTSRPLLEGNLNEFIEVLKSKVK